jgi:hypothetical protein
MPGNDVELVWRGDHLTFKKSRYPSQYFQKINQIALSLSTFMWMIRKTVKINLVYKFCIKIVVIFALTIKKACLDMFFLFEPSLVLKFSYLLT